MTHLKYLTLPTEQVAATDLATGDIILAKPKMPVVIVRALVQRRPRNQSTVLKSLPPANGGPVLPDRLIFSVRSVYHQESRGITYLRPADLTDMFTRVVIP